MFFRNESHPKHKEHLRWLSVASYAMLSIWRRDETPQFAVIERLVRSSRPDLSDETIVATLLKQAEPLEAMPAEDFLRVLRSIAPFSKGGRSALVKACLDVLAAGGEVSAEERSSILGIAAVIGLSSHETEALLRSHDLLIAGR